MAKGFAIGECVRVNFRAEAFYVFNRVRLRTGSPSVQSNTFGVPTSTGDLLKSARQFQPALKPYF